MKIEKKNEVYIRIETEPHIARELSEYFTFEVPGARFMPSYRNKVWDGKIRLFSVATGQIYLGLLPYIREFCKRNDIRYELDFNTRPENIDESTIKSFIKHLKIPYKARDYQISSILYGARKCRGLFVCPTASGKSLIIYGLTRWCHSKNLKTLILVPTTSLLEQMYSDFLDYGWLESYMQKIYQGHDKRVTKDVVISTWQSLYKFPKKYFASAAKKKSNIFLNRLKWKDNRKLLVDTNIGPGQEFIFDAQEVPDISLWAKSLTEE